MMAPIRLQFSLLLLTRRRCNAETIVAVGFHSLAETNQPAPYEERVFSCVESLAIPYKQRHQKERQTKTEADTMVISLVTATPLIVG